MKWYKLLLLIAIFTFTGCGFDTAEQSCESSEYLFAANSTRVIIPATKNSWTNTQVQKNSNDKLAVNADGVIQTCVPAPTIKIRPKTSMDSLVLPSSDQYDPNGPFTYFNVSDYHPKNDQWKIVQVPPSTPLKVTITGAYGLRTDGSYTRYNGDNFYMEVDGAIYSNVHSTTVQSDKGYLRFKYHDSCGNQPLLNVGIISISKEERNTWLAGWNLPNAADPGLRCPDPNPTPSPEGLYNTAAGIPCYPSNFSYCPDYYNNIGGYTITIENVIQNCVHTAGKKLYLKVQNHPPGSSVSGAHHLETPITPDTSPSILGGRSGKVWLKVHDNDTVYSKITDNNAANKTQPTYVPDLTPKTGNFDSYGVNVIRIKESEGLGHQISKHVIKPIRDTFDKFVGRIFRSIAYHPEFINAVRAALVLYIIFYAIMFTFNMIRNTQKDVIIRVVKIAVVIQLISPGSFQFFNEYLFNFFTNGTSYLISVFAGAATDLNYISNTTTSSNNELLGEFYDLDSTVPYSGAELLLWGDIVPSFDFLDDTIAKFFHQNTWKRIFALMFTNLLVGFGLAIVLFVAMYYFLIAVFKAILIYLLSLIAISVLVIVAPIFIAFLLFDRTKPMFDKWIRQLFSYALQPIILFTIFAMFNYLVFAALHKVLGFTICSNCVWALKWKELFPGAVGTAINTVIGDFCIMRVFTPQGWNTFADTMAQSYPVTILDMVVILIFARAALEFTDFAVSLAATLAEAHPATALDKVAAPITSGLKGLIGMDNASKQRRQAQRENEISARHGIGKKKDVVRRTAVIPGLGTTGSGAGGKGVGGTGTGAGGTGAGGTGTGAGGTGTGAGGAGTGAGGTGTGAAGLHPPPLGDHTPRGRSQHVDPAQARLDAAAARKEMQDKAKIDAERLAKEQRSNIATPPAGGPTGAAGPIGSTSVGETTEITTSVDDEGNVTTDTSVSTTSEPDTTQRSGIDVPSTGGSDDDGDIVDSNDDEEGGREND